MPPSNIERFLEDGPRPIYIGFGSIVIDEPAKLTKIILESVAACGVRAIVSRGWSKLGASTHDAQNVLFIDECPHGTRCPAPESTPRLTMLESGFSSTSQR